MKTKIKLVMQAKPENVAGWPHINFNYEQAAEQIVSALQARMPQAEITALVCSDPEAARAALPEDKKNYDGIVLITATNNPTVHNVYLDAATTDFPLVIAGLPHAGDGAFLNVATRVRKQKLPVATVSSMDYGDIAETAQLIELLKKLKEESILIFSDDTQNGMFREAKRTMLKNHWGIDTVLLSGSDLQAAYDSISEKQARPLAEKWAKNAIRVVEPDAAELIKSARLYHALQEMKEKNGCTAVTVDCLSLFYSKRMQAYPCLSFFEMLNNGQVGICEADIDSVLTTMIAVYGCGRPGFVSDPVLDTSSGQIIYDHCVCSNRMLGYQDARASEYYIRSHAEDQKGASVQTLLPLNLPVTTVKLNAGDNAFSIHTGMAVGNVSLDRGCRTKLAAQANVENIIDRWDMEVFGWHKVTLYGNWRAKLLNLARLKGMTIYDEDR
ncbi:MAG: hypothetical protein HFG27_09815 [Provencibacterium sp.]|jgi:L-fucose isomerase-like protein|nr:hypothetical protein [Provencibacterium sp.]